MSGVIGNVCNLYSMTKSWAATTRLFRIGHNRACEVETLPAIFPGRIAPVVCRAEDGDLELVPMSWGFVLPQEGRVPRRVTNVRDDKILISRFWRSSFEERRCLVPVTSFCEPIEMAPAQQVWFALKGDDPRPLFAFAGIWRRYKGPMKKGGPAVELDVYSFMTALPNELTASINHERSPVLPSSEEQFETWFAGTTAEAYALARPYPPGSMRIVQHGHTKSDLLGATMPAPPHQTRLL